MKDEEKRLVEENSFNWEGYRKELIGLRDYTEQLSKETKSKLEKMGYESMRNAFDIAIERFDKFKQYKEIFVFKVPKNSIKQNYNIDLQ